MCDGEKNAPLSSCWIKESACMKRNRLDWQMTNPKPRFITVIHSIQIQNLEKFKEKKNQALSLMSQWCFCFCRKPEQKTAKASESNSTTTHSKPLLPIKPLLQTSKQS